MDYAELMALWDERDRRYGVRRYPLPPEQIAALIDHRYREVVLIDGDDKRDLALKRIIADWEMPR